MSYVDVIQYWNDYASDADRLGILISLQLEPAYQSLEWRFIPDDVRAVLLRRVRVNQDKLPPKRNAGAASAL